MRERSVTEHLSASFADLKNSLEYSEWLAISAIGLPAGK